jgi:hypothetical protein
MKTTMLSLLAVALTGLVFAQTAPLPESSAVERQPLERWLGDWTFETTTLASPFGAGGTNAGAFSVLALLAAQSGEFRDKATSPQENLRRIESDGFDPSRSRFFWDSLAGDIQSFTKRRDISTTGIRWTLLGESRAAKIMPVLAAPATPAAADTELRASNADLVATANARDATSVPSLVANNADLTVFENNGLR